MAAASASTVAESRQRHVQSAGTSVAASTSGHWNPLENGWKKLNTNRVWSSIDGNTRVAEYCVTIMGIEYVASRSLLEDAQWEGRALGYCHSADALRLLQHRSTKSGSFAILNHLNQLCGKDWTIAFSKVDRHNNEVADRLAKLASVATFDVVTFDEPPSEVIPELNLVL
ncbi:hypothetical protein V6N13_126139 [Hibiscus sabdariffa]